jgi:GT2 family glycosyltransferase
LNENYGYCGGYNRGLRQVDADLYVLLNSDIEVTTGWLEPMVRLFETNPTVAVVQPKILSWHHKDKFEYAGAGGGYIDSLGYPFCRGRVFDFTEIDKGQYNDIRETFWASGACLMIRSSIYHKFGGLDEDLFAHMEEIDLCWKINRTEHKVYYCGQSKVFHVGAGTLGYDSPRKTYLNFRNGLILLYKHLDPSELWFKLLLRMILDWAAAFLFLLKGKFANAGSVLKAHAHFVDELDTHRSKRRQIQRELPRYSRQNIYKGIIVLDFFVRSKRVILVNNPR